MSTPTIAVIPGDGIGPEVVNAALQVLDSVEFNAEYVEAAAGYACFQKTGTPLPQKTLDIARQADAVFFGAITTPSDIEDYPSAIINLRQELDLFANLRPAKTVPGIGRYGNESVDVLVVRENTEGLYIQRGWRESGRAYNVLRRTRAASERILRVAFQKAMQRQRRVIVAHKANVVKPADVLWVEVAREVAADYDAECSFEIVDALCMKLVVDPSRYDVIAAPNFYGDILSDLLAGIVGSLGLCASANVGDTHAVFEPVHGSAPDIAGKGIANPIAAMLSGAMMLDHLGYPERARSIDAAIQQTLKDTVKTPDLGGNASSQELTAAVIGLL